MTTSILQYSGYYWINKLKDGEVTEHPGNQLSSTDGLIRKILGVIVGIGADASVIAAGYISADYRILADAEMWSEICGYYTGWW